MSCFYATPADVKAYKTRCQTVEINCTDDDIQEEIEIQQELLERITNDKFCSFSATYTFDGNGKCRLFFFPKVPYKLLTVTTVTEYNCALSGGSQVITDYVAGNHWIDKCCGEDCDETCLTRMDTRDKWICGCDTVEIEGTWGWTETPKLIKRALIMMVLESLSPGSCSTCSTTKVPPNVQTIDWGDYKVTYQPTTQKDVFAGQSTGILEVDRILALYINHVDLLLPL